MLSKKRQPGTKTLFESAPADLIRGLQHRGASKQKRQVQHAHKKLIARSSHTNFKPSFHFSAGYSRPSVELSWFCPSADERMITSTIHENAHSRPRPAATKQQREEKNGDAAHTPLCRNAPRAAHQTALGRTGTTRLGSCGACALVPASSSICVLTVMLATCRNSRSDGATTRWS